MISLLVRGAGWKLPRSFVVWRKGFGKNFIARVAPEERGTKAKGAWADAELAEFGGEPTLGLGGRTAQVVPGAIRQGLKSGQEVAAGDALEAGLLEELTDIR